MSENVAETLIGAAVLVTAAGFVAFTSQSTGLGAGASDEYGLTARFQSAEGISIGSDVRMAGVKIGTVSELNLNPETYLAELEVSIDKMVKIPDDSDIKVSSEGLLGGNYIEISPGGSEFMLAEGDEIIFTQSAVSFLNLLLKFVTEGGSE